MDEKIKQQNSLIISIIILIVLLSGIEAVITNHLEYAVFGTIAAVMVYLVLRNSKRKECPYCGRHNSLDSLFCSHCGKKFEDNLSEK